MAPNVSGSKSEPPAGCEVPSWPGPPPGLLLSCGYCPPSMLRFPQAVSHPPCLGGSVLCKEYFSPLSELLSDPNDLPETTVRPGKSSIFSQSELSLEWLFLPHHPLLVFVLIFITSCQICFSLSLSSTRLWQTMWNLCLYAHGSDKWGTQYMFMDVYWCNKLKNVESGTTMTKRRDN